MSGEKRNDLEAVTYREAAPEQRRVIEQLMDEIEVQDSNSVLFFGSKLQEKLGTISDDILEDVRNKDVGAASGALSNMVSALRGFDPVALDPNKQPSWWERLLGRGRPLVRFLQRYEDVRRQLDAITDELEEHKTQLLTDVAHLDRLYQAGLEYFHDLGLYIAAAEEKLRGLDEEAIPQKEREVAGSQDVLVAQELRDLRARRDDLERRVHDLRLTRQITMQSLPGMRLVQENDKGLVTRIDSTLVNTLPLWRQQLATAVTVMRTSEAAGSVRAASDLTNELLVANAEQLQVATGEARRQIERGVVDIEAVKQANDTLIATIEESLQIADEGKRKRAEAERQLIECEAQLRDTLAAAAARERGEPPEPAEGS